MSVFGHPSEEEGGEESPDWTPEKEKKADPGRMADIAEKLLKMGEGALASAGPAIGRARLALAPVPTIQIRRISNGFLLNHVMQRDEYLREYVEEFVLDDEAGLQRIAAAMKALADFAKK